MNTERRTAGLELTIGIALGISCFIYFRYVVPYQICFKEQLQLFVFSSSYIWSYFSKPAVLACLGGDFLTQLLYFKTGGAVVVTLLLVTEWRLIFLTLKRFSVETRHATSLQKTRYVASLLPVMVEWILFPSVAFSVALSVSFIISLWAFLIVTSPPAHRRRRGEKWGLLLIPLLYMIAGASVFLFLVLVVLYDIHVGRKRFIYRIVISCFAIAIPFIFRHFFLLTLKQAFLFPYPDSKHGLSLVALLVVALFVMLVGGRANKFRIPRWLPSLAGGLAAGLLLIAGLVKYTDRLQENLFGIMIEAYHENWDKVLAIAEKAELKNPVATCYTNIALSKKSLLGERLMDFYQPFSTGLLLPIAPSSNWFTIFAGNDAYYHVGDMEMAQHAAILGMIFTPWQRSARMVERLSEINLATGDNLVADKFLRILESTLFHRGKELTNSPQHKFREDIMRKANDIKVSLELLAESNPDNLPAVDYLLCYYLLNKDIPAFFKAYTSYCKGKYATVPKVYAEALLIYFAGTKSTMKEVNEYDIHQDVIKSFGEYTSLYEQSEGNLAPMQENFSNTYWLYFHFATIEK